SAQDPLLRHVASFRIDQLSAFDGARWPAWNSAALASALAAQVRAAGPAPDLVLIGREFGDLADGSLTPALAGAPGGAVSPPVLVLEVAAVDGGVELLRQQGSLQERLRQPLPVVAGITNHARNRLRHPLLKNVMAAKKMAFALVALPETAPAPALQLTGAQPVA